MNNVAFFTGTPGAISILLRQGDAIPTMPGVTAAGLGFNMQLDNNGRAFYTLTLAGAGVTDANNDSLWLYTPGSGHALLLREGSVAPGTAGATFTERLSLVSGLFDDVADAQREVRVHDLPGGRRCHPRSQRQGVVRGHARRRADHDRPRRPACPWHRCLLFGVQPLVQPDQRRRRYRVPGPTDRRHVGRDQQLGHMGLEIRHAEQGRARGRPGRGDAGHQLRHLHRPGHALQRPRADRRRQRSAREAKSITP